MALQGAGSEFFLASFHAPRLVSASKGVGRLHADVSRMSERNEEEARADDANALVARALSGDARAFDALLQQFESRLLAYIRRFGLGREDAEDALQEVFLRLARASSTLRREAPGEHWLFAVARNVCREFIRRSRHESSLPSFILPELAASTDAGGMEEAERIRLFNILKQLESADREILHLYFEQGLGFRGVGRVLERDESWVRRRYSMIIKELQAFYHAAD